MNINVKQSWFLCDENPRWRSLGLPKRHNTRRNRQRAWRRATGSYYEGEDHGLARDLRDPNHGYNLNRVREFLRLADINPGVSRRRLIRFYIATQNEYANERDFNRVLHKLTRLALRKEAA